MQFRTYPNFNYLDIVLSVNYLWYFPLTRSGKYIFFLDRGFHRSGIKLRPRLRPSPQLTSDTSVLFFSEITDIWRCIVPHKNGSAVQMGIT